MSVNSALTVLCAVFSVVKPVMDGTKIEGLVDAIGVAPDFDLFPEG